MVPPPSSFSRTRPTRDETRLVLIHSAIRVFADHGFAAASIDQLASAAGLTRGAFYSSFATKDDLFLAAMHMRCEANDQAFKRAFEHASSPRDVRERLRTLFVTEGRDREWCLLAVEFQLVATRNERLKQELAAIHRVQLGNVMDTVLRFCPDCADALAVSVALLALSEGTTLQQQILPELVTDATVETALGLIFDRLFPNDDSAGRPA